MVELPARPIAMLRALVDSAGSARCAPNLRSMLLALMVTTVAFFAGRALWTATGGVESIWLTTPVLLAQMMVTPSRQRHWVLAGAVLAPTALPALHDVPRRGYFRPPRMISSSIGA